MNIDETDVVARLRAGAESVTGHDLDADEVLTRSRRALRRRRSWQAFGAGTTAAVVTFALALAGTIPVPGMGEMTLPGSEQIRRLVGLETRAAECTPEDLTVEWGEISSRDVPIAFVAGNYETGTGGSTGTDTATLAGVAGPELLIELKQALTARAEEERQFTYIPFLYGREGRMEWDFGFEDGWGVWWTTSELRSLPGIARCGGRSVTSSGATSAEFTITSWNGENATGSLSCVNPPADPTPVEREAMDWGCADKNID